LGDRLGQDLHHGQLIEQADRPALVLAHNKTLAAQLYHEFKGFFSGERRRVISSATTIFTSREAYVPSADIYIRQGSDINDELDKLRNERDAFPFSNAATL